MIENLLFIALGILIGFEIRGSIEEMNKPHPPTTKVDDLKHHTRDT